MEDIHVLALRQLCEKEGGYNAVAEAARVNGQAIYQIISGKLLKSGKPRAVGREMREKITKAYPGWVTTGQHDGAAKSAASLESALALIVSEMRGRSQKELSGVADAFNRLTEDPDEAAYQETFLTLLRAKPNRSGTLG